MHILSRFVSPIFKDGCCGLWDVSGVCMGVCGGMILRLKFRIPGKKPVTWYGLIPLPQLCITSICFLRVTRVTSFSSVEKIVPDFAKGASNSAFPLTGARVLLFLSSAVVFTGCHCCCFTCCNCVSWLCCVIIFRGEPVFQSVAMVVVLCYFCFVFEDEWGRCEFSFCRMHFFSGPLRQWSVPPHPKLSAAIRGFGPVQQQVLACLGSAQEGEGCCSCFWLVLVCVDTISGNKQRHAKNRNTRKIITTKNKSKIN